MSEPENKWGGLGSLLILLALTINLAGAVAFVVGFAAVFGQTVAKSLGGDAC